MKRLAVLCCALSLVLSFGARSAYALPGASGKPVTENPADVVAEFGIDQQLGAQVPLDTEFMESSGQRVTMGQLLKGKPTVFALVYYDCPGVCNAVLSGILSALQVMKPSVGSDFNVVTVSINPKDNPQAAEKKRTYHLGKYGRGTDGWHFLTGLEDDIQRVARAVGFRFKFDPESQQFNHGAGIMVLTPEGKVSKYFYGTEYAPRDIEFALVEASAGKIGSIADRFVLLCYKYDAARGRYSLDILRVIQAAGLATAGALFGFVALSVRRDRKRSRTRVEQERST